MLPGQIELEDYIEFVVNGKSHKIDMKGPVKELQAITDKALEPPPTKIKEVPPAYRRIKHRRKR
jgi:hypothetical protein